MSRNFSAETGPTYRWTKRDVYVTGTLYSFSMGGKDAWADVSSSGQRGAQTTDLSKRERKEKGKVAKRLADSKLIRPLHTRSLKICANTLSRDRQHDLALLCGVLSACGVTSPFPDPAMLVTESEALYLRDTPVRYMLPALSTSPLSLIPSSPRSQSSVERMPVKGLDQIIASRSCGVSVAHVHVLLPQSACCSLPPSAGAAHAKTPKDPAK